MKYYRSFGFDLGGNYRSSGAKTRSPKPADRHPQKGFSLLEALVTLVILAVGLMGLAFLQAQGMQFNTSAYARTQASILASDIIDRIRLNESNVSAYDTSSFSPTPGNCTVLAAPDANNDRNCWYQQLQDSLPGGNGAISVDTGTGVVTVTVSWVERPGASRDESFDPSTLTNADLVQNMSMSVTI